MTHLGHYTLTQYITAILESWNTDGSKVIVQGFCNLAGGSAGFMPSQPINPQALDKLHDELLRHQDQMNWRLFTCIPEWGTYWNSAGGSTNKLRGNLASFTAFGKVRDEIPRLQY